MKKVSMLFCVVAILLPLLISSCNNGPAAAPNNSIVIWHWMTDREEAFAELSRQYKAKTGVDVKFQLYAPLFNYSQKVKLGAQTDSLPDIYGILGESREMASFIDAGHVENLTNVLGDGPTSWKVRFYPEALETGSFKPGNPLNVPPGIYGIPIDVTTVAFIYNKALFKKAGLNPDKPPKTWEEFLDDGKKLKASGVSGFVSGWAETWLIYSVATDLAYNLMGSQKVMDTFAGKVPYTDPDWIRVFDAFDQLRQSGMTDPSLVSLDNKSAEQSFAQERAGMSYNGSWSVNVFSGMNPNLDFAAFATPALIPKNPIPVWGGAGSIFYVNAKSPNKQKAIDFLNWLTEKDQADTLVKMTKNLPSVKNLVESLPPVLSGFSKLLTNSIHPNRFTASEDTKVLEVMTKGIQSILIGEKTPSEVAAGVEKAKEKRLGKSS